MIAGTSIEYNDIVMDDVLTTQWLEEVVYDTTGVDALYTKLTATFSGVLHGSAIRQHAPGIDTDSAEIHKRLDDIRGEMMLPRKKIKIVMGERTVLELDGLEVTKPFGEGNDLKGRPASAGKNLDVNNGPKPLAFQINAIWGSEVFRVSWSVECCFQRFCDGDRPEVLGNKWAVSESIDVDKYLTKTINGELRLAAYATVPAFGYKYLVIPPLETGFRRESVDFTVSADGLTARYTIVDKQIEVAAPYPAAEFQVSHTERTDNGVNFTANASSEVVGQPNATIGHLVKRAVQLVFNRLNIEELEENPASYMVTGASITVNQGAKIRVSCDMGIRLLGEGDTKVVLSQKSAAAARIVKPLKDLPLLIQQKNVAAERKVKDYDPEVSYVAPDHGYASDGSPRKPAAAAVLLSYLQTPCSTHQMPTDGKPATAPELTKIKDSSQYSTGDQNGTRVNDNGTFEDDSTSNPFMKPKIKTMYDKNAYKIAYLEVEVKDEWFDDEVRAALPVADVDAEESIVVLPLAKRNTRRVINYQATRVGDLPNIPDLPEMYQEPEGDVTFYRMKFSRVIPAPRPGPDGLKFICGVAMRAEYVANKPLQDDKKRSLMKLPHLTANTSASNTVEFADYVDANIGIKAVQQKKNS